MVQSTVVGATFLFFKDNILIYFLFYIMFMCILSEFCVCTMCVPVAQESQKKTLGLLELGLWTVVSCPVGAEDQTELL